MVAANFKEVVSAKQLKLEIHTIDNGEDGWFSPSYIEHILNNLMSNAMKFYFHWWCHYHWGGDGAEARIS